MKLICHLAARALELSTLSDSGLGVYTTVLRIACYYAPFKFTFTIFCWRVDCLPRYFSLASILKFTSV
ncbi:unnamed protein product [Schistosoma rodhaini]|uniref:Uncharacterized protein n=1 Tax=Schistosoma rodhaini TaxID=6188 RepID=A0AA85EX09_9TREM|nr:unnamed protein product [Schistosoma rodhaini]